MGYQWAHMPDVPTGKPVDVHEYDQPGLVRSERGGNAVACYHDARSWARKSGMYDIVYDWTPHERADRQLTRQPTRSWKRNRMTQYHLR